MKYLVSASVLALTVATQASAQEPFQLGTLVFSSTKVPMEKAKIGLSVDVLGAEENVGSSGDLELTNSLKRLPGVTALQNGPAGTSSSVSIRGADERYTAVFIDGIKVNDPSSTSGQYGNFGGFSVSGLGRVEVLKGAQSALHGNAAVAGVISISTLPEPRTEDGTSQRAEVMVGTYGTLATSYGVIQKFGDLDLSFGVSHAQANGFSAGDKNRGNTEADGFESSRLSFGVGYQVSDALRLELNGFFTNNESEFDEGTGAGPVDGTPGDEFGTREEKGVRLALEYDAGGAWQHQLTMSRFLVERSQQSLTVAPGSFAAFSSFFDGERDRIDWRSTANVNDSMSVSFGADVEKTVSVDTAIPTGTKSTKNRGVFAEMIFSPTNDFDMIATLRRDVNSQFGSKDTGRLAGSYRPNEQLTLRGAFSTGFRAPVPSETSSAYPDPLYPYYGNPALKPESSQSIELGFDYQVAEATNLSMTVFRTGIEDLVQYTPCPPTDPTNFDYSCLLGTFSTVNNVPGVSMYKGLELGFQHRFSDRVGMAAAYTRLDARTATGTAIQRVAKHELHLALQAELTKKLSGELSVTHVAGRSNSTSPAQPMPDYTVVDLTMEYSLGDAAVAYLTVQNLFDEEYQQIAGYGTSGRAFFAGLRADF